MSADDAASPCPTCGGRRRAVVVREVAEALTMQTCSRCDATRWYSGEQEVPVDRVLQLVSPVDNLVFEPRPRRQRK